MEADALKRNFADQISSVDNQIKELEENLEKAKEYKLKLIGGLETLALLENGENPPQDMDTSDIQV